jgi:hypothetical protein
VHFCERIERALAGKSSASDGAAALSWDGQTMVFYSNRAGGFGGNDLYMSTREKLTGSTTAPAAGK